MFRKRQKYITLTPQVFSAIRDTTGKIPAETGGIIGSSNGGCTIDHYHFDSTAITTNSTYTPDTTAINKVVSGWNKNGIQFAGFLHSHPRGSTTPSGKDHKYGIRIMKALGMGKFLMPIVQVSDPPDGNIEIHPYSINRFHRLRKQPIVIGEKPKTHVLQKPSF